MKLKPTAVIAVLVLVVASLSIAGCSTSTTSNTNQTSSASATQKPSTSATQNNTPHAILQSIVNLWEQDFRKDYNVTRWEVTWANNTTNLTIVHLGYDGYLKKEPLDTVNSTVDFVWFDSIDSATTFVKSLNTTGYKLNETYPSDGSFYEDVTGHAPQVYRNYSGAGIINQMDDLVYIIQSEVTIVAPKTSS